MVRDPLAAAAKVKTRAQADKLVGQLERDVDQRDDLPPGYAEQANQAIHQLLARDFSRTGGHKRTGGSGGRASGKPGPTRPSQGGGGRRRTPSPAGRRPTSPAGVSRRSSGAARRAWRQTGVPAGTSSVTSIVLQGVGVTIGLSVAYLLLTNTEKSRRGSSAVELLAGGLQTALHVVLAPVDPLAPGLRNTASGQAAINAGLLGKNSPLAKAPVAVVGPSDRVPRAPTSKNRSPIGG